jgi:MFS superfamily sulfate permease-like transporter
MSYPCAIARVASWRELFTPKLVTCLREGYGFDLLRADLIAGLTVAVVALPLAMALAIASGTTPERGLFTAVVAGFLISALGGSRLQIGGLRALKRRVSGDKLALAAARARPRRARPARAAPRRPGGGYGWRRTTIDTIGPLAYVCCSIVLIAAVLAPGPFWFFRSAKVRSGQRKSRRRRLAPVGAVGCCCNLATEGQSR